MIPRETFSVLDLQQRTKSVTVCIPARDEAATIGQTTEAVVGLRLRDAIDAVLVLGGCSNDDTDVIASGQGAEVVDTSRIMADLGPVLGKGDAMWRGLSQVTTDVVVFLDADLAADLSAMVCGLAGPLVAVGNGPVEHSNELDSRGLTGTDRQVRFVKGAFRRHHPDFITHQDPYDGGRVTETVARPLINLLRPDLAGFYQPLGGQVAGDVDLLRNISFFTGYAVEIAMLIEVVDMVGLGAVVQADLGDIENRPRTTAELAPMAQEVVYGFLRRAIPGALESGWHPYVRPRFGSGMDVAAATVVERPALAGPPTVDTY